MKLTIYADASLEGWGGTDTVTEVGGRWSDDDLPAHINVLELYAAKLALVSLGSAVSYCHIKLMLDNMTAVSYVNKMGGTHSLPCNSAARDIWLWAKERNLWLSADHIAGDDNVVADFKSRHFSDNTEWQLSPLLFTKVADTFFCPECDLFASSSNNQVSKFASWYPDTGSWVVNAFSISWRDLYIYAFPPFSIIGRTLAKVCREEATGIMIVPLWSTQVWFPLMLRLLIAHPRRLPPRRDLLRLPGQANLVHPLNKKLALLAIHISGKPSANISYRKQLCKLSATPGGEEPGPSMTPLLEDGDSFVLEGRLIPIIPL